jgi:hypothetical protein
LRREVRFFTPTWPDRDFKKALDGLAPAERERWVEEIAELVESLASCKHPAIDHPGLARWRPSAYRVPGLKGVEIFEYRGSYPLRVVARWVRSAQPEPEVILLLCATLSHDHQRLKGLLERHGSRIRSWDPDEVKP